MCIRDRIYNAKISDGKAVKVIVSEGTTLKAQEFCLVSGFFGVAMQDVKTESGETAELILNIEQAEYETNQIKTSDAFEAGTEIYWDHTNKEFTESANDGAESNPAPFRKVGRVSSPKDSNNVIWLILGPQI